MVSAPFLRPGHGQGIVGVAIRATDGMIATGADDATIRLWRGYGTPLRTLGVGQYVDAVTFSDDGTVALWALRPLAP